MKKTYMWYWSNGSGSKTRLILMIPKTTFALRFLRFNKYHRDKFWTLQKFDWWVYWWNVFIQVIKTKVTHRKKDVEISLFKPYFRRKPQKLSHHFLQHFSNFHGVKVDVNILTQQNLKSERSSWSFPRINKKKSWLKKKTFYGFERKALKRL